MTSAPQQFYPAADTLAPDNPDLLPDLRELLCRHPFLAYRAPEAVQRALRTLHGIEAGVFDVEVALEALTLDGEIAA